MQNLIRQADKLLNSNKSNPDKAISLLSSLIKKNKTTWQTYHLYGLAYLKKSEPEKAIEYLNRAIDAGSEDAGTYFCLSVAYYTINRLEESEESAKKAVEIRSNYFAAWMKLGEICTARGKFNEALQCYQKCNQLDPKSHQVALNIARIYKSQGNVEKALKMYDIALSMNDGLEVATGEKVKILMRLSRYEEAEIVLENALKNKPGSVVLRAVNAELKRNTGEFSKALQLYEKIMKEYPGNAAVRVNYSNILQDLGKFQEAEENFLRASQDNPELTEAFSNYLFVQHYNPHKTKEEIFEALKKWDAIYAPKNPVRAEAKNKDKNRPLRIGLISGGFRKHPVGWMIIAGLEHLPKDEFELYFYSNHTTIDEVTHRLHATASKWTLINGFRDEKTDKLIREDEIDILVELSGHASENKLKVISMEPAPVIVKWVGGLFNSTGLKAIDYLITDNIETPDSEEPFYLEKLVRMPDDYICFTPAPYSPGVEESPCKRNGYITFGCFNNPIKVNTVVLEKWAQLMKKVPGSRLFLKSKQYGESFYIKRIEDLLEALGIDKERLIFEGSSPHSELLEAYNKVDIALDPWPYSGGLTTCEALWMGVPVITFPGPTFAGRHSASHLHNAGFPEWITANWDEYEKTILGLANDEEKLSELRLNLRKKVAGSPLCNGERFGDALGEAFRTMWKQRVQGYENGLKNGHWKSHIELKSIGTDLEGSDEKPVESIPSLHKSKNNPGEPFNNIQLISREKSKSAEKDDSTPSGLYENREVNLKKND